MKVQKIEHSTLLVETKGKTLLIDPGTWTTLPKDLPSIDFILYTHEHTDHFDLAILQGLVEKNPTVEIITNSEVAELITLDQTTHVLEGAKGVLEIENIEIKYWNVIHEELFGPVGRCTNTTFLIDGKLYVTGDSLFVPDEKIEILTLPTNGPWVSVKDSIRIARNSGAKFIIPVHDGYVSEKGRGLYKKLITTNVSNITYGSGAEI